METILCLSIALIAGLLMSRVTKLVGLPAVTAYLVAGILVGPYFLGRLGLDGIGFTSEAVVESFKIISDVALGFIAFAIGNEFRISQVKAIGKQAMVIATLGALVATIFVDVTLVVLHFLFPELLSIPVAITMGAIAAATAPAATLMVVKQYKAKGALTNMLLPVVAFDDAVGLMVFAVSFGIARAMNEGHYDMISIALEPVLEIVLSLVLGAIMGLLFNLVERFFESNTRRLCISITFVLMTVALSMMKFDICGVHIGFSTLLTCMMMSTVFCNICDFSEEILERTDKWVQPLFVLFFVLSGAELKLDLFANVVIVGIGVAYIIARSAGKIVGASVSSKMMKCPEEITKYLGITLLPQAGVALGMSVIAKELLPGMEGELIRNLSLFSVLIYELAGPLMTKIALTKAGNIDPKSPTPRGLAKEAKKAAK
ncbi:MAG: cation:proton antiporter [Clostridia bacterium]|nr:cation:proton antiporter [Clostridia bacterium]